MPNPTPDTSEQLNEKLDTILQGYMLFRKGSQEEDLDLLHEEISNRSKLGTVNEELRQQLLQLIHDTCVGVINNKDAMILSKQLPYFDSIEQYSEYLRNIRDKLRTEQLSKLNELVKGK